MTSSNGHIFRVTGLLCGEFTCHRWIPAQRPVTRNCDAFFDLRLKQLNKQWRRRWFETPSRSLWHHCNVRVGLDNPFCAEFLKREWKFSYFRHYCLALSQMVIRTSKSNNFLIFWYILDANYPSSPEMFLHLIWNVKTMHRSCLCSLYYTCWYPGTIGYKYEYNVCYR